MHKGLYSRRLKGLPKFVLVILFFALSLSCSRRTELANQIDLATAPRMQGDSIVAVQSTNGDVVMRLQAPRMEKYELDSLSYDLFPNGFDVYSYRDSNLEAHIHAEVAKHTTKKNLEEVWEVYGNVVIRNFVNGQTMKTDTLYWDRYTHKIYTDCYVEMASPQGFMQGYGMESDETASNAEIRRPFDSFSRLEADSTYVDTANFIGPILRPEKIGVDLKVTGKK